MVLRSPRVAERPVQSFSDDTIVVVVVIVVTVNASPDNPVGKSRHAHTSIVYRDADAAGDGDGTDIITGDGYRTLFPGVSARGRRSSTVQPATSECATAGLI